MILGRTDLRIGVSGAKFDVEADFEVCLPLAPLKSQVHCETQHFQLKLLVEKVISSSKNETLGIV